MEQWIHRIIIYVISSTILVGITQKSIYQNYIKFFSGVLLILITATPVISVFSGETRIREILEKSMMQIDKAELQDYTKLVQKKKMQSLQEAWDQGVRERVTTFIKSQGMGLKSCRVIWKEENQIQKISVRIYGHKKAGCNEETLRRKLCNKMELGEEQVELWIEK